MIKLLARVGEVVTCPDGHPQYRVIWPVFNENRIRSACFEHVDARHKLHENAPLPCCTVCAKPVFPRRGGQYRLDLYVDGEKRTEL